MQSLKLRREKLNGKEQDLREYLAEFEKYINVKICRILWIIEINLKK